MPIHCRIANEHPQRVEILRLLGAVAIPEDVTISVSPSLDPTLGWEITVSSSEGITACSVPHV
jgi:hypothetical protein